MTSESTPNNKLIFGIFSVGIPALILFCVLLFATVSQHRTYRPRYVTDAQDTELLFSILVQPYEDGYVPFIGWSFFPGETISLFRTHALLYNTQTGSFMKLPTLMMLRPDVTEHFSDSGTNYDRSGWRTRINTNRLTHALEYYEIAILYRNDGNYVVVRTGVFLARIT